jgi:HD-GYP domain-containing protein (c-di-GMP phosphodiesterase class II)
MQDLTLRFPVSTAEGRELLPAGAILSDDFFRGFAGSSRDAPRRDIPFLEYGTIRRDLSAYMQQDVYRHIFGEPDEYAALLTFLERVRLPAPVFDILHYFQRYDIYTYRHILIVSALTCLFARGLAENIRDLPLEASAGPLHDLGKVSVPLELLKRTKPLKRTERAYLEHHTTAGFALLGYYLGDAEKFSCFVARDHHERKDGSGYPRGIRLDDGLLEIVVACDVYDALISPRPYRKGSFDNRTAIEEITNMAEEGKIGWEVVRFLVSRNRKGRPHMEECMVSREKRGIPPEGNLYGIVVDDDDPRDFGGPGEHRD